MQTILCAVDFSSCSKNAMLYAAGLAKEFKSRMVLLHVYETPVTMTYPEEALVAAEVDTSIRFEAEKNLAKLKEHLLGENENLKVDVRLQEGGSSKMINKVVDREQADMIIMGTTGKGKAERIFIGSTTSAVIRHAHCPVLCIPKGVKYAGINNIVYATDLKEDNLHAALEIVTFAKKFNARIVFVYVDDKHVIHSDEYISDMTKKIRSHVKYNKMSGYIAKNTSIANGITYFLKKNPADLLVMFTHQKHFPATLAHPSITGKVSQKVKIPLLALVVPKR